MFYSQFILAKKGPLGTIWIAAHLERKLRKNQVADTDIGVSVDSILFPEVPIALRLSSHLLLGVVRIYSRKVNYLFDDCSEALLKIKQAFRSTAVDLPPEESTAPYHSITLPETFDLDDFELPDNDIFQGNYVDHHVSTREQITLQDTMDGVVYSTSQFGLDERFGDGDTSHVGLDLEEEILLEKVAATGHDEVPENDTQASVEPLDDPETDASRERGAGSLEDMPFNGTRNKVEDLSANLEVVDYAQAPSTPRLLEEPDVSSVKEFLAGDHLEMEDHKTGELGRMEAEENVPKKLDQNGNDAMDLCLDGHLNHNTNVYTPAEEHSHLSGDLEINQGGLGEEIISKAVTAELSPADEHVSKGGSHKMEDNVGSCDNEESMMTADGINGHCEKSIEKTDDVEFATQIEEPLSNGEAGALARPWSSETPSALESVNGEAGGFLVEEDPETSNGHFNNKQISACIGTLQPCNSHLSQPDKLPSEVGNSVVSSDLKSADVGPYSPETLQGEESFHTSGMSVNVQGDVCCATDGVQSEKNQIAVPTSNAEVQTDGEKNDNRLENATSNDNHDGNLDTSAGSELPAPEKLLSVPQTNLDNSHDLLVETPDREVQEDGDGTRISGKKRSFAESSLTVQSLNSVESFEVTRSKRTVDSIPDDDDLLSSILVGRKSSVLKMKPTPPAPEAPSTKRSRLASRPSSLKRKVLMDESMVLHGDTIRQQLTNTEDIRRLRKKAPCSCTEILMIQRQFLEEEIFSEPVLTGMSAELTRLHAEAFDLSGIKVCENVGNNIASLEAVNAEYSGRQAVSQDDEMEMNGQPVGCRTSHVSIHNENQKVDNHAGCSDIGSQKHADAVIDMVDYRDSEHGHLGRTSEMEIDGVDAEVGDAMNHSAVSGDILEMASVTIDLSAGLDKTNSTELAQVDTEEIAFSRDASNGIGLDGAGTVDNSAEKLAVGESELGAGEEFLSNENKFGASVEIRGDEEADASVLNDGIDSLANMSHGTGDCTNLSSENIDQALEETENEKNDVLHVDDGAPCRSSNCIDDKDQTSGQFCSEEFKLNSEHLVEHYEDFKFASMNDGDYAVCQFIDQENTINTRNATLEPVAVERDDIHNERFANDTEFLNVDDDEIGEDDNEGLPNTEDARLLDNSGWSSRTRAVAKYLQNLFDKEAEHGRKVLFIDNLLAGKTRKEASRMFFETLVLKTKDYVHVEQGKPFDSIIIKPRAKLMKSDF